MKHQKTLKKQLSREGFVLKKSQFSVCKVVFGKYKALKIVRQEWKIS